MIRKILNCWTDAVLWEGEAATVKDALHAALASRADLRGAVLTGAVLTGAVLRGAILRGAILRGAILRGADLTGAVLTGAVLTDAVLRGADLTGADLTDAVLTGADLTGADLTDAILRGAVLRGAILRGAILRGAILTGADLTGADLTDAVLTGADLTGADLTGAELTGADLTGADLTGAVLTPIRDDLWAVLSGAPAEAAGLLAALREGRVEGSTYEGACACLVGTLANVRGCGYKDLVTVTPNSSRPIERFFLAINQGDTPETSQFSKLAAEWTQDWIERMRAAFAPALEPKS